MFERSLTIHRQAGDPLLISMSLNGLGVVARLRGAYAQATAFHEERLALLRDIGDQRGIAMTLNNLGCVAICTEDYQRAQALLEEAMQINRQLNAERMTAEVYVQLGYVALRQRLRQQAQQRFEEAVRIRRKYREPFGIAAALTGLGLLAVRAGSFSQAAIYLREQQALGVRHHHPVPLVEGWEIIAEGACARGLMQEATQLCSAAVSWRRTLGAPRMPVEEREMESLLATLRATLDNAAFEGAWQTGAPWSLDQASEVAGAFIERFSTAVAGA